MKYTPEKLSKSNLWDSDDLEKKYPERFKKRNENYMRGKDNKYYKKKVKDYLPTDEEREAYLWCIRNEVKVHVKPRDGQYVLVAEVDGVGSTSGKKYSGEEVYENQWKYYLYLYKKLNDVRS